MYQGLQIMFTLVLSKSIGPNLWMFDFPTFKESMGENYSDLLRLGNSKYKNSLGNIFPQLLSKLIVAMEPFHQNNIHKAFWSTGALYPNIRNFK